VGHRVSALLAIVAFATACAANSSALLHKTRDDYAIQPAELRSLQFYVSTEVLARDLERPDSADGVIVLPAGTPGAVTDVGDTWLRVSFHPGSAGVFFLARPELEDGYWIATETDAEGSLARLKDSADLVLRVGDRHLRVIHGARAFLLVHNADLEAVLGTRARAGGRTVEQR
jgi:hypothetical protein